MDMEQFADKLRSMSNSSKNVMRTADPAYISKMSAIKKGYFDGGKLASKVCSKITKTRAPLVHRCYWVRHAVMHHVISSVCHHYTRNPELKCQIVIFGCGLDTAYYEHADSMTDNIVYIEIDYPSTIIEKAQQIEDCDVSKMSSITDNVWRAEHNHYLLAHDLNGPCSQLLSKLERVPGFHVGHHTYFISEMALCYMDVSRSDALLQYLCSTFPNAHLALYEPVNSRNQYGRIMTRHFEKIQAPLKVLGTYTTDNDQCERLKQMGYADVKVTIVADIYREQISCDEKRRVNEIEPFDEYEEFDLTNMHYCIVLATNVHADTAASACPLTGVFHSSRTPAADCHTAELAQLCEVTEADAYAPNNHKYYAHTLATLQDQHLPLPLGGVNSCCSSSSQAVGKYSACVAVKDYLYIIGGRRAPHKYTASYCLPVKEVTVVRGDTLTLPDDLSPFTLDVGSLCRYRHTAAYLQPYIVVCGGKAPSPGSGGITLLRVDEKNGRFLCHIDEPAEAAAEHLAGIHSHAAALWTKRDTGAGGPAVIITGGIGAGGQPAPHLSVLTVDGEMPSVITYRDVLTYPVYGHTSHIVERDGGDHMIIVGGVHQRQPEYMCCTLDLGSITDTSVHGRVKPRYFTLPYCALEMPVLLHNHQTYVLPATEGEDGAVKIHVCGGGGNCFTFGTAFSPHITLSLNIGDSTNIDQVK